MIKSFANDRIWFKIQWDNFKDIQNIIKVINPKLISEIRLAIFLTIQWVNCDLVNTPNFKINQLTKQIIYKALNFLKSAFLQNELLRQFKMFEFNNRFWLIYW